jgi:tetratricopeptide (TPR) repeat protein
MFREGIFIAACLAIMDTSAVACLWTHDAPVGEDYEDVESRRRVGTIESAVRANPSDRKDLFRAFEYNPANPIAQKNDLAVQMLLRGDAKKAVEMLLDIESETPGKYFTAANLGTAYELAGDDESALRWILEGMKRDPASHMRTEWLHARILETKLKLKQSADWLDTHTITDADYSHLDDSSFSLSTRQGTVDAAALRRALWSQLSVRTLFVKPKDLIVAQLLFELALAEAQAGFHEQALEYLKLAESYGLTKDRITGKKWGWEIIVGWNRLQQQLGSVALLVFPAIALFLLWRAWKMLAR